ncbi:MAG TPA: OsmC family protein [Gemmatimonadaceae bacterium]|nr:OsmC family protein [Gemmatimonadaceae bacterium]
MAQPNVVQVRGGPSGFRMEITARGHTLVADEPAALGGTDAGPTPYDYVAAALGACTAMTIRMYADRRGWAVDGIVVRVRHRRVHERDCEACETQAVGLDQLEVGIDLDGLLTPEQREGLLRIATRCPVSQTLSRGLRIVHSS